MMMRLGIVKDFRSSLQSYFFMYDGSNLLLVERITVFGVVFRCLKSRHSLCWLASCLSMDFVICSGITLKCYISTFINWTSL